MLWFVEVVAEAEDAIMLIEGMFIDEDIMDIEVMREVLDVEDQHVEVADMCTEAIVMDVEVMQEVSEVEDQFLDVFIIMGTEIIAIDETITTEGIIADGQA